MLPDIRRAWAEERERELRLAAERHRLLEEAAVRTAPPMLRERVGRRLITVGARLAGDEALFERLFVASR